MLTAFRRTLILGIAALPAVAFAQQNPAQRENPAQPNAALRESPAERNQAQDQVRNNQNRDNQARDNQAQRGQTDRAAGAHGQQVSDQEIAQCLIIDNHGEVTLAEFAQQKAQDPQVKQFAQMLVKDHGAFIQKLEQFAGRGDSVQLRGFRGGREGQQSGQQTPARPNQPNQREDATPNPNPQKQEQPRAGTTPQPQQDQLAQRDENQRDSAANRDQNAQSRRGAAGQARGDMARGSWVGIKQQISDNIGAQVKKEMESLEPNEFDHAYLGNQIYCHMAMVETLKVLEQHASSDLKQVLQEGQQSAQKHLDHARQLMDTVKAGAGDQAQGAQNRTQRNTTNQNQNNQ